MMGVAPARAAPITAERPTPPQPTITTAEPGSTRAVLTTAPTPVATAQPISAATAAGVSRGTAIAAVAGTIARSENTPMPQ